VKIGVSLVGISGDGSTEYDKPQVSSPGFKGRNWSLQKECVMSQMINCWEGHDVSMYLTTYDHSDINNMVSFYNPKKVTVLDFHESYMQLTYITALQQLVGENLDFIVTVRPDIFPFKKLSTYPIQFDKFNFFHKQDCLWEDDVEFADYETALKRWKVHIYPTYHLVNDTLFMFPASMLNTFIHAIENLHNDTHLPGKNYSTMHNVWIHLRKFLSPDQINYLISGIHPFKNANLQTALHDFDSLEYWEKEYFLCREADANIEAYNKGYDWKLFVTQMKHRLNIS
jgi:hypothetical protein